MTISHKRGSVTRRTFLGGTGVGISGLVAASLVGCGDDDSTTATASPSGTAGPSKTASSSATGTTTGTATAQAGAPKDGSYYSYIGGTNYSLDQHRSVAPGENIVQYAYDNLVTYDDITKGTVRGTVSKGLPQQPDATTYVFTIRDGIAWHNKAPANGRAFTQEDLKWNMDRQISRKLADGSAATDFALYASAYQYIDKVDYPDATHMRIVLKAPRATWIDAMCSTQNSMMYKEIAEQLEKDPNKRSADVILGTGPYMVTKYDEAGLSTAERVPNWYLKKAGEEVQFFDSIVSNALAPDTNARRAAFEQKQLDWIGGVLQAGNVYPPEFIKSIQDSNKSLVAQEAGDPNTNRALIMSFQRGPFANPKIRQAFSMAIDRKQIIDQDFGGQGRVDGPIPWAYTDWAIPQTELVTLPGYRTNKADDLKDAKALWDAGGGASVGPIDMVISEGATGTAVAEWFSAMMKKNLGAELKVTFVPSASLFPYLTGNTFTAHMGVLGAWQSPDPRNRFTLAFQSKGGINFAKYNDPQVDALIDKAGATMDRAEAIAAIKDAQRIVIKDANGGSDCLAGGAVNRLKWPYLHMDLHAWWPYWNRNSMARSWIDTSDPTFNGKPSRS